MPIDLTVARKLVKTILLDAATQLKVAAVAPFESFNNPSDRIIFPDSKEILNTMRLASKYKTSVMGSLFEKLVNEHKRVDALPADQKKEAIALDKLKDLSKQLAENAQQSAELIQNVTYYESKLVVNLIPTLTKKDNEKALKNSERYFHQATLLENLCRELDNINLSSKENAALLVPRMEIILENQRASLAAINKKIADDKNQIDTLKESTKNAAPDDIKELKRDIEFREEKFKKSTAKVKTLEDAIKQGETFIQDLKTKRARDPDYFKVLYHAIRFVATNVSEDNLRYQEKFKNDMKSKDIFGSCCHLRLKNPKELALYFSDEITKARKGQDSLFKGQSKEFLDQSANQVMKFIAEKESLHVPRRSIILNEPIAPVPPIPVVPENLKTLLQTTQPMPEVPKEVDALLQRERKRMRKPLIVLAEAKMSDAPLVNPVSLPIAVIATPEVTINKDIEPPKVTVGGPGSTRK